MNDGYEHRRGEGRQMTFEDAASCCHVRSAIYRESDPSRRYWKNHFKTLREQVPASDQLANDWQEYDPRDDDVAGDAMA